MAKSNFEMVPPGRKRRNGSAQEWESYIKEALVVRGLHVGEWDDRRLLSLKTANSMEEQRNKIVGAR